MRRISLEDIKCLQKHKIPAGLLIIHVPVCTKCNSGVSQVVTRRRLYVRHCSVELTRLQSVKRTIHLPISSMLNTTQHCGQRSPPFTDCDPQPFRDLENTANAGRLSADQKLDLKSRPPQTMKLLHSEFQTLQASSLQRRIIVVRAPARPHCLVQPLI